MAHALFATDSVRRQAVEPPLRVYKRRWALLAGLAGANFFFGVVARGFDSFPEGGVVQPIHAWFWPTFPVCFLLTAFPTCLLASDAKVLRVLHLSIILGFIGLAVRFGGLQLQDYEQRGALILLGHTVTGLGHVGPLVLSTSVSHFWFPNGQRTMATSMSILGAVMGQLSSLLITPLVVHKGDIKGLTNLTYVHASILFVFSLPVLFVWRSRPKTPPSASSSCLLIFDSKEISTQLKLRFLLNSAIVGLSYGSLAFLFDIHQDLLCDTEPVTRLGLLNASVLLVVSAIGAFTLSAIVDSTYAPKTVLRACLALVTLPSCLLTWAEFTVARQAVTLGIFCMVAFFWVGVLSVGLEMAVESMFGKDPAVGSSVVLAGCYIVHLAYIVVTNMVGGSEPKCHFKPGKPQAMQILTTIILLGSFLTSIVAIQWSPRRRIYEERCFGARVQSILNQLGPAELRTRL